MSALPSAAALLAAILEEQNALQEEVRSLRAALEERRRPAPDAAGEALLRAIWRHAKGYSFGAAELIRHAALADAVELREALGGRNARALGRLLRRPEGRELAGLVLYREAEARDGLVWRVSAVGNSRNSWCSPIG
jgi:hypothetical protein